MTQEIVDAVREIEREKGIETGTLVAALEDALLAAYKKTPGATRHAAVELDDAGDFRVFSIELPEDLEERLLDEARERALDELERIEQETGEKNHTLLSDDDLVLDWSQVPEHQITREDVTPENFGRIAAQTAKQVILQRIREAEREMMYDEYIDRVSEVVTGIVQQAGDRNNVLVDLGKVEALLPRSEQVARAHGRLRAPRREDRHHPVEPRTRALRREGAVAGARARGLPRRRGSRGDRRRPGRPARARDRQGGHERPPRPPAHRLEDRHRQRHRVRP